MEEENEEVEEQVVEGDIIEHIYSLLKHVSGNLPL